MGHGEERWIKELVGTLKPAGNNSYPYDAVIGYNMSGIEILLNHVYGLSSLRSKFSNMDLLHMTDKHLDVYFDFY